ncbi:MAG TPA: YciI family protein [Thermoanaerobaculaceae bacterium]|nr:YciI family protein [Thermoanaerobaculaceae bacterium]
MQSRGVPMVLVMITYVKPAEEVERVRPTHREFLDTCVRSGHLVVSGPRTDHRGGVVLVRARDAAEARAVFAKDPFQTLGIATYEFVEFNPAKRAPAFEPFLAPPA